MTGIFWAMGCGGWCWIEWLRAGGNLVAGVWDAKAVWGGEAVMWIVYDGLEV
jgi:hypothetical protein